MTHFDPPEAHADPLLALEHWAAHTPNRMAVEAPDGSYTFAGLRERVAAIVEGLNRLEDSAANIGIACGFSRDTAAAYLACWKIGRGAVPIDLSSPERHREHIFHMADVSAIIGQSGITLFADRRANESNSTARKVSKELTSSSGLAYLIYTSGTTGEPKGVQITRRNLDTFCRALATLELDTAGKGLNPVSPAYDGWLWCFLLYLQRGQTMVVANLVDPSAQESPAALVQGIGPTTICATPTLLSALDPQRLAARTVIVAGEPCPERIIHEFGTGRRMLNVYGPTEATIACTWSDSARGDDLTSVGKAMPGYLVAVLDEDLRPVPDGQPGEICILGSGVADGYRANTIETMRAFHKVNRNGRQIQLYRTGDQGLIDGDGLLRCLGRIDGQVKIRGFRVELGYTEAVSRTYPGAEDVAAFVLSGDRGMGLAVATHGSILDISGLRQHLETTLPTHQVPQLIQILRELPRQPSGKVDRKTLAMMRNPVDRSDDAGLSRTQTKLVAMWRSYLPDSECGPDINFFEAGGHSLLAAQLVAEIRREFMVMLTLDTFYADPTPVAIARHVGDVA